MSKREKTAQPDQTGIIYLVGTPIGNLEDLSPRAVRTLADADWVFCEDTRRTQLLFSKHKLRSKHPLKSLHDHSSRNALKSAREALEAGQSVAYVTDGGMPVVSDPGFVLVRLGVELGVPVVTVPGPSAVTSFFAQSALESPKFLFHGFFPRTRGEIEKVLGEIRQLGIAHLFFESPSRVVATFGILEKTFAQHRAALARELTKVHEETLRGTVAELHEQLAAAEKIRGEIVFGLVGGELVTRRKASLEIGHGSIIPGASPENQSNSEDFQLTPEQEEEITQRIRSGQTSKDVSKELAKKFRVPRRVIYSYIIRFLT